MVALQLKEAVYGPLANGADVQLLALTDGFRLSQEAASEFGRFYFAGWRVAAEDSAPSISFIPLDGNHWGLIRSHVLGRRSMGLVFVSWMLVLTLEELDAIGWRTDLLWPAMPADSLRAPQTGTVLQQRIWEVVLPDEETMYKAALGLASSVHSLLPKGRGVALGPEPLIGGDHESSLAAVIGRLGNDLAGKSYTSAWQVASAGLETNRGAFNLVAAPSPEGLAGRQVATTQSKIDPVFIDDYASKRKIELPIDEAPDEQGLKQLAEREFAKYRTELENGEYSSFWMIPGRGGHGRNFLLAYFDKVLTELGKTPEAAAAIIDAFVEYGLSRAAFDSRGDRPTWFVCDKAIETHAIFLIKEETLKGTDLAQNRAFDREIFGDLDDESDPGMLEQLIHALREFSRTLDFINEPLAKRLQGWKARDELAPKKFEDLRRQIEAVEAALSTEEQGPGEVKLAAQPTLEEAIDARRRMMNLLPEELQMRLEKRLQGTIERKARTELAASPKLVVDTLRSMSLRPAAAFQNGAAR